MSNIDLSALESIIRDAYTAFTNAENIATLENVKTRFLGKTGLLSKFFSSLKNIDKSQIKSYGIRINAAKAEIELALTTKRKELSELLFAQKFAADNHHKPIDISLPGRGLGSGSLHPVMLSWERAQKIFRSMGFDVALGPEIENDWTNFGALNSPANHPARSMQDTFYLDDAFDSQGQRLLLRTHTSSVQVRYAKDHVAKYHGTSSVMPPIKIIALGRTYRVDNDATHSPMFHQIEGLWIAEHISFADLKGVYSDFLHNFFESDTLKLRFRPSYFPFTEPSAEIDVAFDKDRWLEISGAGQVHPNVLLNMGLDPEKYMGFAFGSGIERLTMLRYKISDLRVFYENDLQFLTQFSAISKCNL